MDWDALDEYSAYLDEFHDNDEVAPIVSALLTIADRLNAVEEMLHKICNQSENKGYRRR